MDDFIQLFFSFSSLLQTISPPYRPPATTSQPFKWIRRVRIYHPKVCLRPPPSPLQPSANLPPTSSSLRPCSPRNPSQHLLQLHLHRLCSPQNRSRLQSLARSFQHLPLRHNCPRMALQQLASTQASRHLSPQPQSSFSRQILCHTWVWER